MYINCIKEEDILEIQIKVLSQDGRYSYSTVLYRGNKEQVLKHIHEFEILYSLNHKIADVFDFKIYIDVSYQAQKIRFFQRAKARGLEASADKVYKNAKEKAEIYVCPCAKDADIVISGEADRNRYKELTEQLEMGVTL